MSRVVPAGTRVRAMACAAIALVFLTGCVRTEASKELVDFKTGSGLVVIEVDIGRAPVTATNFLRYVDCGRYDGGSFYRAVRQDNQVRGANAIAVLQGGLLGPAMVGEMTAKPELFPPIPHETTKDSGIRHKDGVVSVARGEPGTASSEFFISIGDNPPLDYGGGRHPDGLGFAAFGRVVAGMDIVREAHARSTKVALPETMAVMKGQILEDPLDILSARRRHGGSRRSNCVSPRADP